MSAGRHDGKNIDHDGALNDAWHDLVTGLPRPRSFLERFERVLAMPGKPPHSVAMLLLRVADFHAVRTRVGQACCNDVLRTIAERLHEEAPEPSLVTRLRGGDFAVVLHDLGPEITSEVLATRLLERANEPCASGERLVSCAVIGALILPRDSQETAMQLLDRGTRALARAHRLAGET
jgi:diguanylate cyclase (GGDEF)-like protein